MEFLSGVFARPAQPAVEARPSLTLFFCGCGAFALTLVPHAVQFPPWLTVTCAVVVLIRCVLEAYRLPLPSFYLTGFLALVFAGLITVQYGTIFGRDAGTAMAAGLLAIKSYEVRRPRDIGVMIFACFFMVMSSLLYSQVLELFVYCLIMMWVLTALLLRLHTGDTRQDRLLPILRTSGMIFLQALPMMLFLFVFFPRYTGTLSFPMGEAQIGLSDTVAPGSVAKLSQDDREAMYVSFDSKVAPTPDSMYFRALVLWRYVGGAWTEDPFSSQYSSREEPAPGPEDVKQSYTVIAHNQRWLFALDVPITRPENPEEAGWAEMHNGDVVTLRYGERLNHNSRYTVISSPERPEEELSQSEYGESTDLPGSARDPGVVALAAQLESGVTGGSPQTPEMQYVYNVLKYFHQGGFTYSAEPGAQGPDWLPEFLLRRKTGFCEHFASAFAVLMRLEHIPVRVVAGYLGGDYNPYSDKWVVSQSNAHAWDEIWVPTEGEPKPNGRGKWMRVDPTASIAAVAPGQLARASEANDTLTQQVGRHPETFLEKILPKWARDALRETQLRREQVEAGWDDLVFSYDPQVQTRLAQAMGFREGIETVFGLAALCVLVGVGGGYAIRVWVRRRRHGSPVETLYAAFCRRMAQRGLPRASWEGPLAYTERVAEAFPEDKPALEGVGRIVARARYGPPPGDASSPERLRALLNELSASEAAERR